MNLSKYPPLIFTTTPASEVSIETDWHYYQPANGLFIPAYRQYREVNREAYHKAVPEFMGQGVIKVTKSSILNGKWVEESKPINQNPEVTPAERPRRYFIRKTGTKAILEVSKEEALTFYKRVIQPYNEKVFRLIQGKRIYHDSENLLDELYTGGVHSASEWVDGTGRNSRKRDIPFGAVELKADEASIKAANLPKEWEKKALAFINKNPRVRLIVVPKITKAQKNRLLASYIKANNL